MPSIVPELTQQYKSSWIISFAFRLQVSNLQATTSRIDAYSRECFCKIAAQLTSSYLDDRPGLIVTSKFFVLFPRKKDYNR